MSGPPTARELEERAAKGIEPWAAVLDYMDGWEWPLMTFEQSAAMIASFYEEGNE